jgi:subtilisin family serine protease
MTRYALALGSVVLAACCIAVPGPAPAQPPGEKDPPLGSAWETAELSKALKAAPDTRAPYLATATHKSKSYAVYNIEFVSAKACTDFNAEGIYIFSRFDKFADAFIPDEDATKAFTRQRGVAWYEWAGTAVVPEPLPAARGEQSRDLPEDIVRGGVGDLTGKGVIIAVIDTGVDFRHPDFIRYDADGQPASRLLYLWDTMNTGPAPGGPGGRAPISYPDGTPVGTVYSQAELTAELRSKEKPRIPPTDTGGHGTACASVAAGNGNAAPKEKRRQHLGVAPDADIIAVRVAGTGPGIENAYLINAACDWIDSLASQAKKPVVISYSVGGQRGAHDGSSVEERRLSRRFADARGRAICIAAGNEGDYSLHAEVEFGGDKGKGELTWVSVAQKLIVIYCDAADPADVTVTGGDRVFKEYHPMAKAVICYVQITPRINKDTGKPEEDRLELSTTSKAPIKADAYMPFGRRRGYFTGSGARYGKQIATPAAAAGVISVGSYDWNNSFGPLSLTINAGRNGSKKFVEFRAGALSNYSNPGPSRDGKTVKPDLVAPGWCWTSAAPPNCKDADYDASGKYQYFDGTSAATPYTAGVVALMFQKNPALSFEDVKNLLHRNVSKNYYGAREDGDPLKNPGWGHGKLDLKAVDRILKAVPAP